VKVYVYPSDLHGCGYYRLIWPSKVLQGMGYDVKLVHPKWHRNMKGGMDADGNLIEVTVPSDADVIVFQRLTSKMITSAIKIMRSNGIAVVIDVDDDMAAIHPANPAWHVLHPKTGGKLAEYDWNAAQVAYDNATLVTTSTPALIGRYARHGRGVVLYNCVPEAMTQIVHNETPNVVGWGGSLHSHSDDPQVCGTAMARLQREGYRFKVVGPKHGVKDAFRLDDEPLATDTVPLGVWPHELTKLAVGIAPLNDTRFNEAKSWLKLLEYAACGVPTVGSPRAEYRRLNRMGVGLLADNPRDWYRHVRRLMDDDAYRADIGAAGRQVVIDELTIERNALKWWHAWEEAYRLQSSGPRSKDAFGRIPAET
jgi:hypothetical protein